MAHPLWLIQLMAVAEAAARKTTPYRRSGERYGLLRNKPCRCGSGKKTKRCCGEIE